MHDVGFFLPEADEWRSEAWAMIKERQDLSFVIETKREHRFLKHCPATGETAMKT